MTEVRAAFRHLLAGDEAVFAPLCLDALGARVAAAEGFRAGYVSGGALGYAMAVSEALLTLTEIADVTRNVVQRGGLPTIVDVGVGFGDPVHVARTVWEIEATGAVAIELEDQVAPKRVSHHRGIEHLVDVEVMCAKLRHAVAARQDPDFLLIARTGAIANEGFEAALARCAAYRAAGADMVMLLTGDEAQWRQASAALDVPLATITAFGARTPSQWRALGCALVIDPITPQVLAVQAVREAYRRLHAEGHTGIDPRTLFARYRELPTLAGLDPLYAIEDDTTERGSKPGQH
jgi:methylisocitrate lyase